MILFRTCFGAFEYTKNGVVCQKKRARDMKEDFRPVLQVTITRCNIASKRKEEAGGGLQVAPANGRSVVLSKDHDYEKKFL
jgi:hypothetical protein